METIVEKFILQLEAQLAARRVQTEVRDPLTDEILFGRLERGGTVRIGLEDDKLAFVYETAAVTVDS